MRRNGNNAGNRRGSAMPASPAANHADTGLRISIISIVKRLIGSIRKIVPLTAGRFLIPPLRGASGKFKHNLNFDSSTSWSLLEIQVKLEFRDRI